VKGVEKKKHVLNRRGHVKKFREINKKTKKERKD